MTDRSISLQAVAGVVGGVLEHAEPSHIVTGIHTLKEASSSEVSFLANVRYKKGVGASRAAAILVAEDFEAEGDAVPLIRVADPYLAFALLQQHFFPLVQSSGRVNPSAVVDETARLADDVDVGAGAVIGANAVIGAGSVIGAGCVIGARSRLGEKCLLHPRAVVAENCILGDRVILQSGAVIGSDGFGYAWSGSQHVKIPQVGRVILEDDVEIGANSCIDRGALEDTVIRRGVKLDNLIQIGHNVEIGAMSVMASQVGISGSTIIGQGCQIGGQVGIAGHLKIGDGVKLAAKTGVLGDLEAGGTYAGLPAMPHRKWLKASALVARLPELLSQLRKKK